VRRTGITGFVVALAGLMGTLAPPVADGRTTEQPIQFNHQEHTQGLELECTLCHDGVADRIRATLPGVAVCIGCHEEAVTDSPEEEKIRAYAGHDEEIPWQRLYRVPRHVFFSHRRHVHVARVECTTCHGDVGGLTRPPVEPLKRIAMKACLACHRDRGARTDCVSCHR